MVTVAALGFASPLYAVPADLIGQGSSGWNYRIIDGVDYQNLANNFWSLNFASFIWATSNTGSTSFGNTQTTASQSALGQWLDSQGLYLPSQTPWDSQTALLLTKTFTIADPSLLSVNLSVASANGFIAWVNGDHEVYRDIAPGFTSYWEYDNLTFSSSLLASGTNTMFVLAIDDAAAATPYDSTFFDMQLTADIVPEPASAVIFLVGLVPAMRRRRRK